MKRIEYFERLGQSFNFKTILDEKGNEYVVLASIIQLKITPSETKTILDVSLRWPKLTSILLFCFPVFWIIFQAFVLFSGVFDLIHIPITILLFAWEIIVIITRKKHDLLAIRVFENILLKNFGEYCHRSEENESRI